MKYKTSKAVAKAAFLLLIGGTLCFTACNNDKKTGSSPAETAIQPDSASLPDSVMTLDELNAQIRENPLNPDLYAQRAGFRAIKKEFNQALNDIELALKLDSLNYPYYIMQAEYYIYNGQPNSAKKGLNDCLRLFPNNTDVMLKLAEIHFYLKEYAKAQMVLKNVTLLNEDLAQIYFLNGLIFLENSDTVNGVRNLQHATEKDPDFYSAFLMLGRVYANKGNDLAITYFKSAIDVIPESYEAHYNLALFLQGKELIDDAVSEYEYIITNIDSTSANPYYNLGYINLIFIADFDKAVEYFTEAIEREPDYVDAWYNRGFSYEVSGKLKLAREDYEKSLEIKTNYPLSIKGLNRLDEGKPFKFD